MRNTLMLAVAFGAAAVSAAPKQSKQPKPSATPIPVNTTASSTTCNGKQYAYKNFAGYGFVPYDARDSRKDTIGGIGSSAAIEKDSWELVGKNKYSGILWGLPDRGFNVYGTINYQPRIQKFKITFDAGQTTGSPNNTNVKLVYKETIFLTDPSGTPMTGLDGDIKAGSHASFPGFPDLPVVHYTGDGFGNNGTGGTRVPLDAEGLVLNDDGSFWISDEYGPYVYKFNSNGKMIEAIRPPNAFIPQRNGTESFSADSPPIYNPKADPSPADPVTGRQNNQGLEGLTISPNGKKLFTLMQSALRQDGGNGGSSNRYYDRFLTYDITGKTPKATGEYVVKLPLAADGKTAAQSEIHYISDTQFFVLARDSNHGVGLPDGLSTYRHIDVFDISNATNILGKYDDTNGTIVTAVKAATLKSDINIATYCSFLNYNDNTQLGKFGLHNGGAQDAGLLNEKWESIAMVPVHSDDDDIVINKDGSQDYFVFSLSDNDFRAIDVYVNSGKTLLHDTVNAQNQVLVFKISLPKGAKPLVG
ncbi:hypothetical protein BT63DRAFT_126209 [Microthyrium microscopicum]|uniref:Phytase-like domain-containing protein n=1 Tax=Microthyrium microscopicum TaxID=703497 RepID=A0A6A6TX04_9PEZI|nr:hypothetical protein BT63DRAFT_126209 [Microthyrium microscopicum]